MNKKKILTAEETFALAVQNHKKNNLQVAENLYNKTLKKNPNHFEAIYYLGTLLAQTKRFDLAKPLLHKAIQIQPNYAMAHNNLGVVLKELGEHQKAISSYEKAIQIKPNYAIAHNNLGLVLKELGEHQKAIACYQEALKLKSDFVGAQENISNIYISQLDDSEKAISESYKTLKMNHEASKFINQRISLFRLKHDVQQAKYLSSKNYKINGIDKFQKIGDEILSRKENKEDDNNFNKKILLNEDEINALLPFYKENHIYKPKIISESCINPNKNWQNVEDEYLNSPKQIMYIDNFLSDEAIKELREFCLVSKVWNREFDNKYLGSFSDSGFISPIHLQIAIDLKKKLPKLFGPHRLGKFWGFKYDSTLGKGINIHADFAIHNLNFWITPDEYNNNKNSGGLKVYDTPAPENWTFHQYNTKKDKIYKFLNDNNTNCTNVHYKFNRAVLFNSAYFHETDEIDFKDKYEGRRINNTYLFGSRLVKKKN